MKRFLWLVLSAILLFSQNSMHVMPVYASEQKQDALELVDGDSLEPGMYDVTLLEDAIAQLEHAISMEDAGAEVEAAYNAFIAETDAICTMQNIDHIFYYRDVNNEEYVELYTEMDLLTTEYLDRAAIALCSLLNSPYAYIAEAKMDEINLEYYREYQAMTARQKEIDAQITKLISEYSQLMLEEMSAVIDGDEVWTDSSVEEYADTDDADYEIYYEVKTALERERNQRAGEIYRELVSLYIEQAKEEGEDNFADWRYRDTYIRDYTTEDIKSVYESVKKFIVPLEKELMEQMYSDENIEAMYSLYTCDVKYGQELVEELEEAIYAVSDELGECYTYMKEHHLVDMEPDEAKTEVGFTTSLYSMGVPYIFYKPYGWFYDYGTLVHEFGHFNNAIRMPEHAMMANANLDTAEIHSQGLELLAMDDVSKLFGEEASGAYKQFILLNIVDSVIQGCLFDEFQVEIYSHPDYTLDDINSVFFRLAEEYGCEDNYMPDYDKEECYGWIQVNHTFEVPMYYISYATSALAALDIYVRSLEDRDAAIELYLRVTETTSDVRYCELLEQCGLDNIFEKGTIEKIAQELAEIGVKEDSLELPGKPGKKETEKATEKSEVSDDKSSEIQSLWEQIPWEKLLIIVFITLFTITVILVIIILITIRRNKK